MGWYVFALVDAIPTGRAGKGLTGALSLRKLPSGFVVVERRADVPPTEFGSLKKHQDVVARLATQVPAILPVRFGTLLETAHLEEALQERDEEILEAFDLVRGRVQFTWRIKRRPGIGDRGSGAGDRGSGIGDQGSGIGATVKRGLPKTGAEYLRRAAKAANPAAPPVFRALRTKLAPLTDKQRYQPATPAIPEAVYHLVEQKNVDRYAAAAGALKKTNPQLTVSGPFPPFAFAPEIL
jgi:Gas vesicle synthesis protein GvpL/GvpF